MKLDIQFVWCTCEGKLFYKQSRYDQEGNLPLQAIHRMVIIIVWRSIQWQFQDLWLNTNAFSVLDMFFNVEHRVVTELLPWCVTTQAPYPSCPLMTSAKHNKLRHYFGLFGNTSIIFFFMSYMVLFCLIFNQKISYSGHCSF